ncbi:MAG: hypothetical protein PUB52_00290 [Lachnospiraceae bacterium]|nr:hypothetical protein [Lachnospiraceae bacterium]
MEKAICFGAADGGKRLFNEVSAKYEIISFTDNDKGKVGGYKRSTDLKFRRLFENGMGCNSNNFGSRIGKY